MTDWFRLWHGAPTDPKWRTIAKRAGVRPVDVWGVVSMLMDRASQATERGTIKGYDSEIIADALGVDDGEVDRIIAAMVEKAVIVDGRFAAWDRYQPKREDGAADRAKAWRDSKKLAEPVPVTGTPNASERNRTQPNAREEESRVDTEKSVPNGTTPQDGAPVMDAKDRLWADGPVALESFGVAAKRARPIIGKWLRDAGDNAGLVLETIQRAEQQRIIDPIPWITQAIAKNVDPPPLRLVNAPLLDANGNEIHEPHRPRTARAQFTDAFAAGLAEAERALNR